MDMQDAPQLLTGFCGQAGAGEFMPRTGPPSLGEAKAAVPVTGARMTSRWWMGRETTARSETWIFLIVRTGGGSRPQPAASRSVLEARQFPPRARPWRWYMKWSSRSRPISI